MGIPRFTPSVFAHFERFLISEITAFALAFTIFIAFTWHSAQHIHQFLFSCMPKNAHGSFLFRTSHSFDQFVLEIDQVRQGWKAIQPHATSAHPINTYMYQLKCQWTTYILQRDSSKESSNRVLYCSKFLRSGLSFGKSMKIDRVPCTSFLRVDPQIHHVFGLLHIHRTHFYLYIYIYRSPHDHTTTNHSQFKNTFYDKSRSSALSSSGFLGFSSPVLWVLTQLPLVWLSASDSLWAVVVVWCCSRPHLQAKSPHLVSETEKTHRHIYIHSHKKQNSKLNQWWW